MPSLIGARLQPDWGEPNVRLIGGREETGASRLCRAARGASRLPDNLPLRARTLGDRWQLGLGGLLLVGRWLSEQLVEAAREVALQAPQRAFAGLACSFLASEVLLGRRVALRAGDRDHVQRVVELAVPAAVEPVLGALP